MDILNFDAHNILLNDQPYPCKSIRPQYPTFAGDNSVALFFPWWKDNELWRGDVTTLINGQTELPFANVDEFKNFCDQRFYNCGQIVQSTYASVRALYDAGTLSAGTYYLIQDFQTVYDQPDYYWSYLSIGIGTSYESPKTGGDVSAKTGVNEPLLVFATSSSTLSPVAYSIDYPKDVLKYNIGFDHTEVTEASAFGRIIERIDEKGNRTDYDWRNVEYKRYVRYEKGDILTGTVSLDTTGGIDLVMTGLGTLFTTEVSVGDVLVLASVIVDGDPIKDFKVKVDSIADDTSLTLSIPGSNYLYPVAVGIKAFNSVPGDYVMHAEEYAGQHADGEYQDNIPTFDPITSSQCYIGDFIDISMYLADPFLLPNSVIGNGPLGAISVKTGCYFKNNTIASAAIVDFGDLFLNNIFLDDLSVSSFGNYNAGNIFHKVVSGLTTDHYVITNEFTDSISAVSVGSGVTGNKIGGLENCSIPSGVIDADMSIVSESVENVTFMLTAVIATAAVVADAEGNQTTIIQGGQILTRSADTFSSLSLHTEVEGDTPINEIRFVNEGGSMHIRADTLTDYRSQQLQDKDGTIALTSDLINTVNPQTGTGYTLSLSDTGSLVTCDNSAAITITIPTNASVAFPVGTRIDFTQLGMGQVTFTAPGGVTMKSLSGNTAIIDQFGCAALFKIDTDIWVLKGDLTTSSAPIYTTWNFADKGSAISLSGGDLIASTSGAGLVRSHMSKSSGKWYWEVTAGSATTHMVIGVATSSANLNGYTGSDINGWGIYGAGAGVLHNGGIIGTGFSGYNNGDIIGCALDMDAQTIQFYLNGVIEGSLITGLGAVMFPSVGGGSSGVVTTANFGATSLAYTPPSGFNAGVY